MSHSTSITTGHGGEALGNWMARGLGATGLGNSRGPSPTCTIPIGKGTTITMPAVNDQSWAPRVAEGLMSDPGHYIPGRANQSSSKDVASGSLESTHDTIPPITILRSRSADFRGVPSEEGDDLSQQELSDVTEDEEDLLSAKTSKPAYKRGRKAKEKKKVGRPIAYRGDPNAPELTDQERRRIKRRIANRESARRVRHKRQEELEDMQIKMEQIQAHNSHLQQHAANIKEQREMLLAQLPEMEQKSEKVCIENKQLTLEIQALRQSLQLKMSALEDELDKRATEAEGGISHFNFSHPAVQSRPLSPLSQAVLMNQLPMDGKASTSASLDWLPSLNLDELTHLDVVNHFYEDIPASALKGM